MIVAAPGRHPSGGHASSTTGAPMSPGLAPMPMPMPMPSPGPNPIITGPPPLYSTQPPSGPGAMGPPPVFYSQPANLVNFHPGPGVPLAPLPNHGYVGPPPPTFSMQPGATITPAPQIMPPTAQGPVFMPVAFGPQPTLSPPPPVVGAWDFAKIIGGHVIDLKCFTRLPGLKPQPAQIVNGILDLALIWCNPEAYIQAAITKPEVLTLVDPLNFDACWHIGQDHRSFWEGKFRPERETSSFLGALDRAGPDLTRPITNAQLRHQGQLISKRDKAYGRTFNMLRNTLADIFENRTSVPYCVGFKPAWPPRPPRASHKQLFRDDTKLLADLNRALDGFQTVRWGTTEHYGSHAYTGRLAAAVGLPDGAKIVNQLYPNWNQLWKPSLPDGFGTALHRVSEEQARFHLIGIACCGVYRGHHGWHNLSWALAHGAWPWLRGYDKGYAKAVYVLMVSICCTVELGHLDHTVFPLLMALAGCLVGRSDVSGGGQWRIRHDPRLRDPRVEIQAVPHPTPPEQQSGLAPAGHSMAPPLIPPIPPVQPQEQHTVGFPPQGHPGTIIMPPPIPSQSPLQPTSQPAHSSSLATQPGVELPTAPTPQVHNTPNQDIPEKPLPLIPELKASELETQPVSPISSESPVRVQETPTTTPPSPLPSQPAPDQSQCQSPSELPTKNQTLTPAPVSAAIPPTTTQPTHLVPQPPIPIQQLSPAVRAAPTQVNVSPHCPPQPWTFLPTPPLIDPSLPANHILPGKDCNHGPSTPLLKAHVRVTYSLAEVQSKTADGQGLTVALTKFDPRARAEVEEWAKLTRTLTVKRSENMCICCAVRMAHIVSALVIIG